MFQSCLLKPFIGLCFIFSLLSSQTHASLSSSLDVETPPPSLNQAPSSIADIEPSTNSNTTPNIPTNQIDTESLDECCISFCDSSFSSCECDSCDCGSSSCTNCAICTGATACIAIAATAYLGTFAGVTGLLSYAIIEEDVPLIVGAASFGLLWCICCCGGVRYQSQS